MTTEWIRSSWEQLSATTIANGYKKCDILPTDECIAASSHISLMKNLTVVRTSGMNSITCEGDFDRCEDSDSMESCE